MVNINSQTDIQAYLQQVQNSATRQDWSQTIIICQQIIAYCRHQLEDSSVTTTIQTYLAQGDRALSMGKTTEAIAQYSQALKIAPDLPQINQKLGEALGQQNRWHEANTYYRRAVELNQNYKNQGITKNLASNSASSSNHQPTAIWQMYLAKADLCRSQGQITAAIKYYEQAQAIQPNSPELIANLGNLYAEQQQWSQAIAAYERALTLKPNFSGVYRNLAKVLERAQQPERAADNWYKALQLEPDWATCEDYFKLGTVLELQQKNEPAITCYRQAIALNPQFTSAYLNLGAIFLRTGQLNLALNLQQQLAAQKPNSAAFYLYQGMMLKIQQQLPQAIASYQQAIKLDSQLWEAYYQLAEIYSRQEEWSQAVAAYSRASEGKSNSSWLYHNLGYANLKLQRWSESYQALAKAVELNPRFVWSHFHLATAAMALGQRQTAIISWLRAIAIEPNLSGVYQKLGIALRQEYLNLGNSTKPFSEVTPQELTTVVSNIQQLAPQQQTSEFYCQVAADLTQHKQYIGAAIFYGLAAQLQPDDLQITNQGEQVKQLQQQLETGIDELRHKIQQHPEQPWYYIELGNTLADLGEFEAACALHRQTSVLHGWGLALEIRQYRFHYNWFTHNIRVWQQQLQSFAHRAIAILEIGSFEGMATCWLLDYILTHPAAKITCVDLYFQDNFNHNIAQTNASHKVTKLSGNSHHILPTLTANQYDIVYIDGSHQAEDVKQDATLAWDLLKLGGVMIFDDYLLPMPENPHQEPKIGIDTFLQSIAQKYKVLHQEYQLLIEKVAD